MNIHYSPEVEASMLIRKPAPEVFQAFIDPAVTSNFWFTKASGKLEAGKTVAWHWEMYEVSGDVHVKEIIPGKKITIEWGDPLTTVDFELLDQEGKKVTQEALSGKIYVADFIFTTCQSICPKMSAQMERVYGEFKDGDRVMFLSHTVNPERDSVATMAAYAEKYHAESDQWLFLTGDKKQLYELARKSYFAVVSEGDGGPNDFIHTQNFMLVDQEKRIRGYYDGTSEEEADKLINDMNILLEEPKSK